MIWPYDERGRLIGENVWEYDESEHDLIKLDPERSLDHGGRPRSCSIR